jgi:transglutaminase-like putative cysteine protease
MRTLLLAAAGAAALAAAAFPSQPDQSAPSDQPVDATRTFAVCQTTRLSDVPAGTKLVRWWIAIPDDERHQDVLDFDVVAAPGAWRVVRDLDRGNRFLYVEVESPTATELSTVVEFTLRREPVQVAVDPALVPPIDAELTRVLADELRLDAPHMTVTEEVAALAKRVCGDATSPAVEVQRLLEHVAAAADHYSKDPTKPNCGIGSIEDCMANGGGCCTDLHSMFIALARARGIPARLQMGYRLNQARQGEEYDPGYRCWAEYFLPGLGWIPTDIVEADALGGRGPERWFSGLTEWRLWLDQGREFRFAGMASAEPINTVVIAHAEIDGVTARVLPQGDLPAQHARTIRFTEVQTARRP